MFTLKQAKEVLEGGKIINVTRNYEGSGKDRIIIAAHIKVKNKPCYMGAVVERNFYDDYQHF